MLAYTIGLLLLAAAIFIVWKSWTKEGFNWRTGIGALAALLAGLLVMAADWLNTMAQ
jgi:hypothetical protein